VAIKGEWIRYGDQTGYLALPERAAALLPSVIVIQEVGGVNAQIEDVTRRIAASGYAALAPDLFAVKGERPAPLAKERIQSAFAFMSRLPPGGAFDPKVRDAELAKLPKDDADRIKETFTTMFGMAQPGKMETLIPALKSAFRHLRSERRETRGKKTACVGFCMGGGLSALLSCEEPELSAAAVFYGTAPSEEKIAQGRCPIIGFYGENDQRVNIGIPGFADAMKKADRQFESIVYKGAGHAFFNDEAASYEVDAARDSFARLLEFFRRNLTG
jgi:carboxymethylenebutenolidase